MNRLTALFAAFAMALALVIAPSVVAPEQTTPTAAAQECRIASVSCGRVSNHPWSSGSLTVTYNWSRPWSSIGTVRPGNTTSSSIDTDGYYIRSGWKAWHVSRYSGARITTVRNGPQWVKVSDFQNPWVMYKRR